MKTLGKFAIITGLICGLSAGTPALAIADALADTPLPSLPNTDNPTKHLFSVNTVTNVPGITTSFHCTSTKKMGGENIRVGIEIFENGVVQNDVSVGAGVAVVPPGWTRTISIDNTATFVEISHLDDIAISRGSARILADSNKLICTASLVDPDNVPPHFITTLPLIKKTMQKGQ